MPGHGVVRSRIEADIVIEDWRRRYDEVRPHPSPGYLLPLEWGRQLENRLSTEARFQMAVVSKIEAGQRHSGSLPRAACLL